MNWTRVKWILIVMLLLGNLLLAGFYWRRLDETRRDDERFHSTLLSVLTERGVTLAPEVEAQLFTDARRLYAPRDLGKEAELAAALLGQVTRTDMGGRIFEYENGSGWARFRGGGQFEVDWITRQAADPPAVDALQLLRAAGFTGQPLPAVKQIAGGAEITLDQFINGLPVFDAFVRLTYDTGGALVSLSGQWVWGNPLPAGDETPCPVLGATLLRFSAAQRDAGMPVSHIQAAQLGYRTAAAPSEYICLIPVWLITSDGRVYYTDAETGAPVVLPNE